jgi:hypothetical protein
MILCRFLENYNGHRRGSYQYFTEGDGTDALVKQGIIEKPEKKEDLK